MNNNIIEAGDKKRSEHMALDVLSYKFSLAELLHYLVPEFMSLSIETIMKDYLSDEARFNYDIITAERADLDDCRHALRLMIDCPEDISAENTNSGSKETTEQDGYNYPDQVIAVEIRFNYSDEIDPDYESSDKFSITELENIKAQYWTAKFVKDLEPQSDRIKKIYSIWIYLFPGKEIANSGIVTRDIPIPYYPADPFSDDGRNAPFADYAHADYNFPSLINIEQIYVGGPEYPNFGGIYEFLYDLLQEKDPEKRIEDMENKYGWHISKAEKKEIVDLAIEQNDYLKFVFGKSYAESEPE